MLALIFAVSENGVIGKAGGLPWKLSNDLQNFRTLTIGHPVIMGRKTYESIGKPLPGRYNIVVTRDEAWNAEGVIVCHSIKEAFSESLKYNKGDSHISAFVIGGTEIYMQALPYAECLHVTKVHAVVEGDTFLDTNIIADFNKGFCNRYEADDKNEYPHSFEIYTRPHKISTNQNPFQRYGDRVQEIL